METENYTLIIKYEDHIEFKAIFTSDGYFRVQVDEIGYEKMIDELWEKGYEVFEKVSERDIPEEPCKRDIFDVTETKFFDRNITKIHQFLLEEGFDCELIKETKTPAITVTAYGKDLHPDVIANSEEVMFADFTIDIYKAVNSVKYEPKIERHASSFKVTVQETSINSQNLDALFKGLKNKLFDTSRYFNDEFYKKFINSFISLKNIRTLNNIKINDNDEFIFTKDEISEYEAIKEMKIQERPFSQIISMSKLRAFDDKNLSFKFDSENGVLHIHAYEDDYGLIKNNKGDSIELIGTYKSIKGIQINRVNINF